MCLKLSTVGAEQSPVLRAGDPVSISDLQGGAPSSRIAVKEAPSPTSAWGRSPVFCSRKPVLGGHTFVRPRATHPGLGHHCPARARTGQTEGRARRPRPLCSGSPQAGLTPCASEDAELGTLPRALLSRSRVSGFWTTSCFLTEDPGSGTRRVGVGHGGGSGQKGGISKPGSNPPSVPQNSSLSAFLQNIWDCHLDDGSRC